MRLKPLTLLILLLVVFQGVQAQDEAVLPAQMQAIQYLSKQNGFDNQSLNHWLEVNYAVKLDKLSRTQAGEIIRAFQSDTPPKPLPAGVTGTTTGISQSEPGGVSTKAVAPTRTKPRAVQPTVPKEPMLATILEPGMSKRFHLVDGNIIFGTIKEIKGGVCLIETEDGSLKVPAADILEETASITKKDDTRYVGPVLKEDSQEIVLRSKYGDVVIGKKDIKDMNRYHGGKLVPWAEEKKTFYQGSEVITDIFMDPTAFPLEEHTFYISGLSLGYGFTEKFMLRTKFGSDFGGDLNLQGHYRFYHRATAAKESAAAIGLSIHRSFSKANLVAKYSQFIEDPTGVNIPLGKTLNETELSSESVLQEPEGDVFFSELYFVVSNRRPLSSGRGKVGTHFGFRTNTFGFYKEDLLDSTYAWVDAGDFIMPFRFFAAFEYDLSKNLKFQAITWADNSNKAIDFGHAWDDYFGDDTRFVFDSPKGDYTLVDFDFGFLYSVNETFRFGLHFQQPYLIFYWEFYEL